MFNKIYIDALIQFLYVNLKKQPVTKLKIKLLFKVFEIGWKEELLDTYFLDAGHSSSNEIIYGTN